MNGERPGWIKLHRKILNSALWKNCNANQKVVLITLLLMADFEENAWIYKNEEYKTGPGEFITSLQSISELSGCTVQVVRTCLLKFEKYDFLTNKSTNKNRLIKIENWTQYQYKDDEINKDINKRLTSNEQAANKQLTTNKNIRNKESKNIRNNTLSSTSSTTFRNQVLERWNSLPNPISKIQSVNAGTTRYKSLKARFEEFGEENIFKAIENIKTSSFLLGSNDKGWIITFDWFLKPSNFQKVLEGNYKDKIIERKYQEVRKAKSTQALDSYMDEYSISKNKEAIREKIEAVRSGKISFRPREDDCI